MSTDRLTAEGLPPTATVTTTATVTPEQHQSMTELVSGIVSDAERLFRQQIDMVRAEFKEDVRHTRQIAQYMGIGIGLCALGVGMLIVALVHLLNWIFPALPLWACWAIIGGLALVAGVVAVYVGARILAKNNPLPDKSFQALEENVSWITNRQS
jgi:hypothetical protein